MNAVFLNYQNLTLLNVPHAEHIYEEVFVQDCYRLARIPQGSIVMDVGGYYGEFGIWCAHHRGSHVKVFEPSPAWRVAQFNAMLNNSPAQIINSAIGRNNGPRAFGYRPDAPYGSRLDGIGRGNPCVDAEQKVISEVPCLTLKSQIELARKEVGGPAPIVVKLDCEGGEQEIFEEESWLDGVTSLMMEFHFKDGPRYRDVLRKHGFSLDTTDPNPEAWSAIIYANR